MLHPSPAVPTAYEAPFVAYLLAVLLASVLFLGIISFNDLGYPWVVGLLGFLGSYGLLAVTRCLMDGHPLGEAFNPRTQSWAMLADLALVGVLILGSHTWRNMIAPINWRNSGLWEAASFGLGGAMALGWSFLLDRPNYFKVGAGALTYDPAKIGHDLVTYWVLGAATLYIAVPALIGAVRARRWAIPAFMMALFSIWIAGNAHDTLVGLDVHTLHDAFNWDLVHVDRGFYGPREN